MKKRLLALLLAVMVVASCLTIGAAAMTTSEVKSSLDTLMTQPKFALGPTTYWGSKDCYPFINAVSQEVFGESIPSGTDGGYYLTGIANFPN